MEEANILEIAERLKILTKERAELRKFLIKFMKDNVDDAYKFTHEYAEYFHELSDEVIINIVENIVENIHKLSFNKEEESNEKPRNSKLYINGSKTSYRCEICGANVFCKVDENTFICNGCRQTYTSE